MYRKILVNKYILIIGFLILLNVRFFYFINTAVLPFTYTTFCMICAVIFIIIVLLRFGFKVKYEFKNYIIFSCILAFTSAIAANRCYGQPVWMGLSPQRGWIVWLLCYFPLVTLLKNEVLNRRQIFNVLYIIAISYLAIVTIQYFIPNVPFLNVTRSIRYGEIRLYVGDSIIMIISGYSLYKIITENSLKNGILFGWCLFLEAVIMKGRAGTITMLIATIICLIISNRNFLSIRIRNLLMIIMIVGIFLQLDIGRQIIDVLQGDEIIETSEIRKVGRDIYISLLSKDWITALIGCGYANLNWANATYIIRGSGIYGYLSDNILTVDNGMYGFALYYGLIGIMWCIFLYLKCIRYSWKIYKKTSNIMFIFFIIWDAIGAQTLYWDCTYALLEFPLYLALLETVYCEYCKSNEVQNRGEQIINAT